MAHCPFLFNDTIVKADAYTREKQRGRMMDINLEQIQVVHNLAENRFETWVDEKLSKLDYIQD